MHLNFMDTDMDIGFNRIQIFPFEGHSIKKTFVNAIFCFVFVVYHKDANLTPIFESFLPSSFF